MRLVDIAAEKINVDIEKSKDKELIADLQARLAELDFYHDAVDGIVGVHTLSALAKFKAERYLDYPTEIGVTTANSLLEGVHPTPNDQVARNDTLDCDEKTGASMMLPTGDRVYANQRIIKNIPLTWGEVSKDCVRVPYLKEHVGNLVRTARGFGEIRLKYNLPIGVTSGIRPDKPYDYNKQAGGVKNSQHIYGLALDIYPLNGDFPRLLRVIRNSDAVGIGLGQNQGFYHVDWRSGDRVIFTYG